MIFFLVSLIHFLAFLPHLHQLETQNKLIGDRKKKHLDFFQKLFCQESVKDPPKVISTKVSGPYLDQEAKIGNFSPG